MPSVSAKRKAFRYLAPLPKGLQALVGEVIKASDDYDKILVSLRNLASITWIYEKGDLFQWVLVLDVLDKFLENKDAKHEDIVVVLRCFRLLLENCSNRHVFNSYEHLQRLLESDNTDVVISVLRVLCVLAAPRSTRQFVADSKFVSKLSTLAAAWGSGSGDRVLTLGCCCVDNVGEFIAAGTTVHMETYQTATLPRNAKENEGENSAEEGLTVIHIEQVHKVSGSESEIFDDIVRKHSLPKETHFELMIKLRHARSFPNSVERLQWVRIQIAAIIVLAQCQGSGGVAPAVLTINEASVVELLDVLQSPGILLDIQTLALKALTALLSERSRPFSSLVTSNATSHHGVLPSLFRKLKALLDCSSEDVMDQLRFGESLLGLTWTFAGSNTGASALNSAGIVHMLVPLLQEGKSVYVRFLTLAVKTLEVLMNYSQDMQMCFRSMNGVNVLVDLAHEVAARLVREPMSDDADVSNKMAKMAEYRFENCRLLSSILHLLSSAATPVATTTDVRELASGTKLPFLLNTIFKQHSDFSAGVFEKAAALLTEFVHQEPGCLQQLISSGVAESFLLTICGDYPVSRGVVNAIPSALGALCLSPAGTQLVEAAQPLEKLLKGLGSERVVVLLHGDCPSNLGVHLEELMRHNPSLIDSSMGSGCVSLVSQIPSNMLHFDTSKNEIEFSNQMYLIAAVEFVGKLLEPLMSVTEHARSFIRKGGVKALFDILKLEDLPKNFTKTEAGKYLVLVIGKAAQHAPSDVVGDLIQRTLGVMKRVSEKISSSDSSGKSARCVLLEGSGERDLFDLETHVSLLAGVIATFRASSSFSEWNTPQGSELLCCASKISVFLRVASVSSSNSSPNRDMDDLQPPDAMQVVDDGPIIQASQERMDNADPQNSKHDDVLSQANLALSAMFARLTSGVGAPSRRRAEDRQAPQNNEKLVAAVVASSLIDLIKDSKEQDEAAHAARYTTEVVEILQTCIFGDDSLRTRNALNMVVLQELVELEFVKHWGQMAATTCKRICKVVSSDHQSSELNVVDEDFTALSSCLMLTLRLLSTPFNSVDRNGVVVPHPTFDSSSFCTSMKVEIFKAVNNLWKDLVGNPKVSCPLNVSSLVLDFAIQHMKPDAPALSSNAAPQIARNYDPATVTALMEMGFDERRVHLALDATRGSSVEMATEWLFAHGGGVGRDDEESEIARAMALSLEQHVQPVAESSSVSDGPSTLTVEQVKTMQSVELRAILINVCFNLLSKAPLLPANAVPSQLPFAVADVFGVICQNQSERSTVLSELMTQINCADSGDISPTRTALLWHVLSILVTESADCCKTAVDIGFLKLACDSVLKESQRIGSSDDADSSVALWICPCLLAICGFLKYLDEVKKIDTEDLRFENIVNREEQELKSPIDSKSMDSEGPNSDPGGLDGEKMVQACVGLVSRNLNPSCNHAVLQLLTRLTRIHKNAWHFMHVGGVQVLLNSPVESTFAGHALLVGSILRHILEDQHTLQACMQVEIRSLLSSLISRNNGRPLSLRAFLSAAATVAQRDPVVFIRAVSTCCQLAEMDGRKMIQLTDKKEERAVVASADAPKADNSAIDSSLDVHKNAHSKLKTGKQAPEASGQLIGILVDHMLSLIPLKPTTGCCNQEPVVVQSGEDCMIVEATSEKKEAQGKAAALNLSNILRFLTELVKFFPGCSHAVMKCSVPARHRNDVTKRHTEGLIGYVLHELLPGHPDMKAADATICSQRAAQLIAALFGRGSDVRKKIVTEVVRAVHHCSSCMVKGQKTLSMLRLQSLGDLLGMLLSPSKGASHTAPEIAKLFLDASLPSTISSALGVVDLQHPSAPKVGNSLLRPLDLLCSVPVSSSVRPRQDANESAGNTTQPNAENDASPARTSRTGLVNMTEDGSSGAVQESLQPDSSNAEALTWVSGEAGSSMEDRPSNVSSGGRDELPAMQDRATSTEHGTAGMGDREHAGHGNRNIYNREASEEFDVRGQGEDEDEDDDQDEHDEEGSEEEESTMDVEEESEEDDEEDEADGGAHVEQDHPVDFLGDEMFIPDPHGQDDGGLGWPRSGEVFMGGGEELDHIVQRVIPHMRMARSWGGDADGDNADAELDDNQIFGFWMHGAGGGRAIFGHGGTGGLYDALQDMHVIQFGSRFGRSYGGVGMTGPSSWSGRLALNEGAAGVHPFLSRPLGGSNRFSRGVGSRPRPGGVDDYRALIQSSQVPGFLLPGGARYVFGEGAGSMAGRDELGMDTGWSRWTDDGSGSNTGMRNASLSLESHIQVVLSNTPELGAGQSSESAVGTRASEPVVQQIASQDALRTDAVMSHEALSTRSDAAEEGVAGVDVPEGSGEEDAELALALRLSMESASSDASQSRDGPAQGPDQEREPADAVTSQDTQMAGDGQVEAPAAVDESTCSAHVGAFDGRPNSLPSQRPAPDSADSRERTENTGDTSVIDAAFLAELPEDLRAEVIAQQNSQSAGSWPQGSTTFSADAGGADDGGIDPEFLAALPPEIQADVLRQHRLSQPPQASADAPASAIAGEMDNGSFIATLSPELREEVLLTADEALLASLPPHLAAEAALIRERAYHAASARAPLLHPSFGASSMGARRHLPPASGPAGDSASEATLEVRQVLPTGSEKSVVRLVELSTGLNKGLLNSVLVHLCAHAVTRPPTLRLLLALALAPATGSRDCRMSTPSATSWLPVARRALEALCHVAGVQPAVAQLLLDNSLMVEHEASAGGKGKNRADGRDKASCRTSEFVGAAQVSERHEGTALESILLRLADPDVVKSPATLDLLVQLISATVTPPKPSAGVALASEERSKRIPVLAEPTLQGLALALGILGSGRQTGDRLMSAIQTLCSRSENRSVCVPILLEQLGRAAVDCCRNLDGTDARDWQEQQAVGDDGSNLADLRLLRLAKTLRSVWLAAPKAKEEASEGGGVCDLGRSTRADDLMSCTSLSALVGEEVLWSKLSRCLSAAVESHNSGLSKSTPMSSISPALSRLQPLMEAFFVVHAPMNPLISATGASDPGAAPSTPSGDVWNKARCASADESSPAEAWIEFAEKHRNAVNAYLRQDKTLLQSSSTFACLVAFPKLLDFDNKKSYFRAELKKRNASQRYGTLRISVRREFVLEDSFHQLALRLADELKGRLHVTFQGEEGVDAGGLSREWFLTLSKQMLNPDKALFMPSANGLTFQPNPASGIQPDHLGYFRFSGQVVAKALLDEQLLDAHFTLPLYKHILNQPIEVKDVESIDPEYYRNLGWMLENDITSVLEETFSIVREQFGEMLTIDLKPNGRNLPVTEANKHEYVQLVAEHVMTKGIRQQVDALKQGFHQVIPSELIQIFSPQELELLLCGLPSIDVEDLRANTEYTGYSRDSPQIQWFWTVVQGLSQEDLARLVQFVTGTSQVPMEGFQALRGMNGPQRFNIHRCGDSGRLPSSHTCFNQLDLPEYPSCEVLQRCLLAAVREGFEGFGFS